MEMKLTNSKKCSVDRKVAAVAFTVSLGTLVAVSPVYAQEARIALSGGLDRLDPSVTGNGNDLTIVSQIYDTLVEIDPETGKLVPKLAESFEATTPTVWTFHLRKGVKFHNGSPLTAGDVKFSIERIIDPKLKSSHSSQLTSVKEVRAIDDLTVEIETKKPDPVLIRRMQPIGGTGRVFIVSKAFVESKPEADVATNPMGTGPYRLEAWDKGQQLVLTRNENYWGKTPDVKRGIFTFIPENSTRVNALLKGEVDVIQRLPIADVDRVKQSQNVHIVSSPNGLVHILQLDSRTPPFDDINVRKAFAHALDSTDLVEGLLGEYGRVIGVPLSPSVAQFDDAIKSYEYDPALSKKLLAGKTIKLETFTSDGRYVNDRDFYQVINSQLAQVGFDITSQSLEWGRFVNMMQKKSAGPFYITGWDFSEGDASKMNSFLQSEAAFSIINDKKYDSLVAEAGQETNEAHRTELWKEIQQYVHDQYYIPAVWQASALYGFSNGLEWKANFGDNLSLAEFKVVGK